MKSCRFDKGAEVFFSEIRKRTFIRKTQLKCFIGKKKTLKVI